MHWRITLEAVDPTGEEYRQEFLFEKDLDGLTEVRIGCSIEDSKEIMRGIQKAVVQREVDLRVRYRRALSVLQGSVTEQGLPATEDTDGFRRGSSNLSSPDDLIKIHALGLFHVLSSSGSLS